MDTSRLLQFIAYEYRIFGYYKSPQKSFILYLDTAPLLILIRLIDRLNNAAPCVIHSGLRMNENFILLVPERHSVQAAAGIG